MNKITNYSTTFFYKIYCKDENISDKYIGHTINFVERQKQHKRNCINPKSDEHNRKLYKFIRDNNGWDNWEMELLAFHKCENLLEAKKYEQQYFEEYKATLNSIEPLKTHHNVINAKNNIETELAKDDCCKANNTKKYNCNICNIHTDNKKDMNKHLLTQKHLLNVVETNVETNTSFPKQICENCNKQYSSRSGLWKHKTKCDNQNITNNDVKTIVNTMNNDDELNQFLIEQNKQLMEQNKEIKELLIEQNEQNKQLTKIARNITKETVIEK